MEVGLVNLVYIIKNTPLRRYLEMEGHKFLQKWDSVTFPGDGGWIKHLLEDLDSNLYLQGVFIFQSSCVIINPDTSASLD